MISCGLRINLVVVEKRVCFVGENINYGDHWSTRIVLSRIYTGKIL